MKNLTKSVTFLILVVGLCTVSKNGRAETSSLVHIVTPSAKNRIPDSMMAQRTDFEDPDKFYRTYFGKTDAQVKSMYESQWRYHDMMVPYAMTSWRYEHLSIASLDFYDRAPYEWDVRRGFAEQVLRMRIDSGVRAALYEVKNPTLTKSYAKLKNTMDQINNYPLRLSSKKDSKAGELRLGYDVLSDASKIEYVQGLIETGLYHPKLVGLMMNQMSWDSANLRLSTNFGGTNPKASLSVPLHRNVVEGSVSKVLSDSVSATVSTGQPWKDRSASHSYNASVAYSF